MSLPDTIQQFHFIRPDWLLFLLPAFALFLLLLKRTLTAGQWQNVIDKELLPYVLENAPQKNDRGSLWLILFAWVIATLALAGPSWQKMPTPVEKNQDALVILLDMSLSMGAQDVKPDRATRAIQKVTDIIRSRKDGLTALLTYSGEAHTVTPLTDDRDTIENLLPAISPFIMPKPGSRPDKAIALAQQLVTDAGINKARLLLITDGIIHKDIQRISSALDPKRFQLKVMTLGTAEGAPVSMPNSGFLRDGQGNIVLPKLDLQPIRQLVSELNIAWQPIRYDDQDWQQLLQPKTTTQTQTEFSDGDNNKQFDQWFDQGFWLIFLLLPVTLLLFRRGVLFSWLLVTALVLPTINPAPAWANDTASAAQPQTERESSFWQNLWQTPDQQGAELLNSDPAAAAQRFDNPDWQGVASYQAGDYQAAQQAFANNTSAHGRYNYANALAQSGELQAALDAYDEALQQQPDFADAAENRNIVAQALKQQQQNPQQQNKDGQPQDSDKNQSQKQNGDSSQQTQDQHQDQDSQQNPPQSGGSQQQKKQQQKDPQQDSGAVNKQQDDAFAEQKAAEQKTDEQTSADQKARQQAEQSQQQNKNDDQQQTRRHEQESDPSAADSTSVTQQQLQESQLTREEQAAMQQWLNRIPDNPGNLLQRKFLYQYRQQDGGQAEQQEDVLW